MKRFPYIDIIRIMSMFGIIILHSAAYGLRTYYFSATWWVLNAVTALYTCAVPLFFMISGALILSSAKTDSLATLKTRLPKLVIPLLFWSLACIARDNYYIYKNLHTFEPDKIWQSIISVLGSPAAVHLWFMYALIPLYILAPFVRRVTTDRKLTQTALVIWIAACAFKSAYIIMPGELKMYFNIDFLNKLNPVDGFLGYFILGSYLHLSRPKLPLKISLPLIVLLTGAIAFGTYYATAKTGEYSEIFKSYTNISVIALSATLFMAAKRIKELNKPVNAIVAYLSSISMGVYMSGNFFLGIMRQEGMTFDTAKGFVLCCIYTFALCFTFISLLKQIKPLCFIATGNKYKNPFKKQQ